MKVLLICLGGSLGALSRYYLAEVLNKLTFVNIPIGILGVNFIGCFLLGLLINYLDPKFEYIYNPLLFVGFLGAFTTFSAFSRETIDLISSGNLLLASTYIFLMVFSCLAGTWCGMLISR